MTVYLNISVCPALSNVSFLLSVRMAVKKIVWGQFVECSLEAVSF